MYIRYVLVLFTTPYSSTAERSRRKDSALTQTGSTLIPQRTKTGAPRIERRGRGTRHLR